MEIKYKFNKSRESIICKVESVELEIIEKNIDKKISLEELKVLLIEDDEVDIDIKELQNCADIKNIVEFLIASGWDYFDGFKVKEYDLYKSIETGTSSFSLGGSNYIKFEITSGDFGFEVHSAKAFTKGKKEKITKQFISPESLKHYINSIEEPIKFIGTSTIDDVLLKEWLVKEEKIYVDSLDLVNSPDHLDIIETYFKRQTKVGSPKLNPNWTFNLK